MNRLNVPIFLGFLLLGFNKVSAKSSYDYLLRQPISLEKLATKNFTRSRKIRFKTLDRYVKKLMLWNTHIPSEHYEEIPIGTEVYLDVPYSPYVPNLSYADKLMLGYEREKTHFYSMNLGVGIFQRRLSQVVADGDLNLNAIQRSPVSLDSSFFMAPREGRYQLAVNFKLSHLLPSTSNANSVEFPATQEYSLSPFATYSLSKRHKIRANLGTRYQRFVTFNLEELAEGQEIKMIKYDIGYLAAGLSWSYKLFDLYSTLEFQYSRSLWSQNDRSEEDPSFSSNIVKLENSYEVEDIIYSIFYELENSKIGGIDSSLTRFGGSVRFYLF